MIVLFKIGGCSMKKGKPKEFKKAYPKSKIECKTVRQALWVLGDQYGFTFKHVAEWMHIEYGTLLSRLKKDEFGYNDIPEINRYLESLGIKERV